MAEPPPRASTALPLGPAAPHPAKTEGAPPAARPRARGSLVRRVLLMLGPIALLIGATWFYLSGGRYVVTDNAYVRADKLNLATDVSGVVAEVLVKENAPVQRGQVLFRLDEQPFRIALAGAEARIGMVRTEIATLKATYRQNLAQIEQARADVTFQEANFQRQQDLMRRGVSTQATFDQVKHELEAARERMTVARRAAETTLSQIGVGIDDPVDLSPRVMAAAAQIEQAKRDLARAVVTSPMTGIVTNLGTLQVGQYLPAAQPALSLVSTERYWITANPKETEIADLSPGHEANVVIDAYPGRVWKARVATLAPATGAEFSVLPAQNASGNWIKVIQRVPITLALEVPPNAPPLRAGMSATVEIDTGRRRSLGALADTLTKTVGLR